MQNQNGRNRAVSLLSGGLDSSTMLAFVISKGYKPTALSFDYGQRHSKELQSAKNIADYYKVDHKVMKLDLRAIGGSALTDNIDIPDLPMNDIGRDIPVTYVPARNTILLSIALGLAETLGASRIFIGANAIDYSGYPDCRPEYYDSINQTFKLATRAAVLGEEIRVEAPLISLSKSDIVKLAHKLKVPLEKTWSCYTGKEKACGKCDSCKLRLKGFMEAGLIDPVPYESYPDFYVEYLEHRDKSRTK